MIILLRNEYKINKVMIFMRPSNIMRFLCWLALYESNFPLTGNKKKILWDYGGEFSLDFFCVSWIFNEIKLEIYTESDCDEFSV